MRIDKARGYSRVAPCLLGKFEGCGNIRCRHGGETDKPPIKLGRVSPALSRNRLSIILPEYPIIIPHIIGVQCSLMDAAAIGASFAI
jgi:hypothetical protein